MAFRSKIILGTANFSNKYGLLNKKVSNKKVSKILNLAEKAKINSIDTSPAYGESEKMLGEINKDFKIYSKIPKLPNNLKKNEIKIKIVSIIFNSLKNLKKNKTQGLLLQDANILLSSKGKIIYSTLKEIKTMGLTKNLGISIYNFKTLKKIINKYKFDFVQVPLNLLNRDLLNTNMIEILKRKKIKIHIRSIFMQGILLLNINNLPRKLKKLSSTLNNYDAWLKQKKLTRLDLCLNFVLSQNIDKIIIGVSNLKEFKQILKYDFSKFKINSIPKFQIKNRKLIEPNNWSKL